MVVEYAGAAVGSAARTFLMPDERGSIAGRFDNAGTTVTKNSYDEYGIPGAANVGRFQYTGQAWIPELGMYYYKARIYSPTLGRFLQVDPIGYEDQVNLYGYVGNDPVNASDPSGTYVCQAGSEKQCGALDSAIKQARHAAGNLNWKDRLAVNKALNAYGARGVANGVAVYAASNVPVMQTATISKDSTLVAINSQITSARQLDGGGSSPGGNAVHEGQHIYDGRHLFNGRNWQTYSRREHLTLEKRAYEIEGKVDRGAGWSGRGGNPPLWRPGMSEREMKINAYRQAWEGARCTKEACGNLYDDF